jgi:hypothetical protein
MLTALLAIVACSIAPTSVVAQGLINWANTSSTLISVNGASMPVRVSPETTYYFGLFVAPLGTPAPGFGLAGLNDPNWQFVAAYAMNSTAAAGAGRMQNPGTATVAGFAVGTTVNFIVRVWQSTSGGADWEAAKSGLTINGQSALGTAVLGGGAFPSPFAFGTGAGQIGGFSTDVCLSCGYKPWFEVNPSSKSVAVGSDVTLVALARSYADCCYPVGYTWRKNSVTVDWANTSSLTIHDVQFSDAGNYDVVAYNIYGVTYSSVATLTVFAPAIAATLGLPTYTTNNQFQFTVTGTAGSNYVVQVATSHAAPTTVESYEGGDSLSKIKQRACTMKKLMTFLAIVVCPIAPMSVVAQGLINWNNTSSTLISVGGSPMPVQVSPETTYYFGLFIAPLGTSAPVCIDDMYDPHWQYVAAYAMNSTAPAGAGRMQNPGIATVIGYAAGTSVNFIVRAWPASSGAYWSMAMEGPGYIGQSALGTAVLGGGPFPIPEAFGTNVGQINGFNFFGCPECHPPYFTLYPSNAVVGLGGNVSFTSYADSWSLAFYQWRKQGSEITGATSPVLTLTNVSLSDGGNYDVVVRNKYGGSISPTVTLKVMTPAVIGSPHYTPNNQFQFIVTGAVGSNYVVQVATNLVSPITWVSLFTNTSPFTFVDSNAQNFPQRFYRVQAR